MTSNQNYHVLVAALLIFTGAAPTGAATSVWTGVVNASFTNAGNWDNSTVPTDNAEFGVAPITSISVTADPLINSMTFDASASSYTFAIGSIDIYGAGIINNSSSSQTLSVLQFGNLVFHNTTQTADVNLETHQGSLYFHDSSSAATAKITNFSGGVTVFHEQSTAADSIIGNQNGGLLIFYDSSSANDAVINSSGAIAFDNASTVGNATITNNNFGQIVFVDSATADHSKILNSDQVYFFDATSGGQAEIINVDPYGYVDISGIKTSGLTLGSIGGGGNFYLGSKSLTEGGNGVSTTVTGAIEGPGGSLIKVGTGTLTLSGANIYTGGTIINGGIVRAGTVNTLPLNAPVSLANTAGAALDLNGYNQQIGSLSGGGSVGGDVTLGSATLTFGYGSASTSFGGAISGNGGSLVKTGTGTFTLAGINTYTGGTILRSGILQIDKDQNLGDVTGALTVSSAATVQMGSSFTSHHSVVLSTGGGIFDTGGFNTTWNAIFTGPGGLSKEGDGILTLSKANQYSGGTFINAGTVRAATSNALPFGGTVVLANVAGAALDLNGFDQTVGSLSGGGAAGGGVNLGTATLTMGADNTSTTYAGILSGSGAVIKNGNGVLTLSSDNIYTGPTQVNSGTLSLTGSLAGDVTVGTQGVLTGAGRLKGLTNEGAVTPGNQGVGSLSATSYSGHGALNIYFNGATHTSLNVASAADIGGSTLNLIGPVFAAGQYSILSAGSLRGTFAAETPPSSVFYAIDTQYTPTDVIILIRTTGTTFASVAQNVNEAAVATALDAARGTAAGGFSSIVNALLALPNAVAARNAFDQISGDALASFSTMNLKTEQSFTDQMNQRAVHREATSQILAQRPIAVVLAGNLKDHALGAGNTSLRPSGYGLWVHGLGSLQTVDASTSLGSPSTRATTGGFQAGYDIPLSEELLVGIAAGYASTSLTIENRSASGDAVSTQTGFYASYVPNAWFVNGSIGYTTSSDSLSRPIEFQGISEQANSRFQSRNYSSFLQAGYLYKSPERISLEPSVSLRQSHWRRDAFIETDAPGLDLGVPTQTVDSLLSSVGAKLTHRFRAKTTHPFNLGASAAWQHELLSSNNSLTAQFADAPSGGFFTVQATPRSRNDAALGLNARVLVTNHIDGFADYSATLGSGQQTQAVFGGIRLSW